MPARLEIEKAPWESEEQYRVLFEGHPSPMWVFDLETFRFLAVNDAAIRHYGYSREEFLKMTVTDIRPEEEAPKFLHVLAAADSEMTLAGVWIHRKKDGSLIDVEVTSNEVIFEGRPARIVAALDVTERKRLEEELRQSQKMEAIGQLAGGVAHDFNNVLTLIAGYSDLALESLPEGHAARTHVEEIQGAADRAAALTRQILAFSRRQVLHPQALDLNVLLADMRSMLRRLIGEHIDLQILPSAGLGTVRGDSVQMQQVLLNLAVNARDAMPQGGRLTIETDNFDFRGNRPGISTVLEPGSYVLMKVSDTGHGMPAHTLAHVFEPFFTTKGLGTGLGLSTVCAIMKRIGGKVDVTSKPGVGSTFRIYLPRIDDGSPAAEPAATHRLPLRGEETILLVEDEASVRRLVCEVLRVQGFTVLEAFDTLDAIRLAEVYAGPIHLLLTDVVMPRMNGGDLASRLRQSRRDIRALFISGHPVDQISLQGMLAEGAPLLQKPFTAESLTYKIREVLDARP